ncbi:UDP-3-O-(3-hydroxymyristoyl)glucosamine N-acyltransferase [subsurface metagenome]
MSYHPSNEIAKNFIKGMGFQIGFVNLIEGNVRVGKNVTIKNFVELRNGTRIGDDCYIDSRVSTSGGDNCRIGNNVTLRYGAIIARNVVIEDDVFISPQVGFINIPFKGKKIEKPTRIGKGALIGFNVTIREGITIAPGVIVGAKANVTRDLLKAGTYIGNPARLLKRARITKGKNVIIEPGAEIGSQPYLFTQEGDLIIPEYGVTIQDNAWIGTKCVIMNGKTRNTYIGKNVKLAQYCNIGHDSIIQNRARLSAGVLIGGYAEIGKDTVVGMGAIIRNRVKVGTCSFIGQGSNVVKDIPDNVIAYGNPCKVVRKRFHTIQYLIRKYMI